MSVRSRTSWTSSCLILPATRAPSVLLQEPAPGKEELLVRPEGEPVRHPGDVVGDAGGRVPRGQMVLLGDLVRMVQVVREQRPQERHGLVLLVGGRVAQ